MRVQISNCSLDKSHRRTICPVPMHQHNQLLLAGPIKEWFMLAFILQLWVTLYGKDFESVYLGFELSNKNWALTAFIEPFITNDLILHFQCKILNKSILQVIYLFQTLNFWHFQIFLPVDLQLQHILIPHFIKKANYIFLVLFFRQLVLKNAGWLKQFEFQVLLAELVGFAGWILLLGWLDVGNTLYCSNILLHILQHFYLVS